jgi:predicted nucleic acid-binding Zn ribbon protein
MDVAANTLPAAFRQQLLLVNVSSSVWIQELRFKKEDIIRKLNDAVGKSVVSEITFKVGPIR